MGGHVQGGKGSASLRACAKTSRQRANPQWLKIIIKILQNLQKPNTLQKRNGLTRDSLPWQDTCGMLLDLWIQHLFVYPNHLINDSTR